MNKIVLSKTDNINTPIKEYRIEEPYYVELDETTRTIYIKNSNLSEGFNLQKAILIPPDLFCEVELDYKEHRIKIKPST